MPFIAPDARWLPFMKIAFGYALLLVLASLCAVIALWKVEAATSFGLDILIGGLLTLSGSFAQWCFTTSKDNKSDDAEVK